ncbi:uncharacterized protein LOC128964353 [Oppia nitens]|uniref:uncharacterized protein LOC128964353 n=1 Tax=Oppia nitens TaxID=1686743 RepID=UPI0023DC090F|nr:uncharacterized protein LOC128964353 [Oppia nitens]
MRYKCSQQQPMSYQIIKYSLISLLSLMILCTTLAIILVCLVSVDYNNNLNDRSLGIIFVLTIITIVFLLGLVGVSKAHLPTVLLFTCADLFLLVTTYYGSYSTRNANMGAFIIFLVTTVLSLTYSLIIWRKCCLSSTSATTERLLRPHRHNIYDYEDYDTDSNSNTTIQPTFLSFTPNFNDFNGQQPQQQQLQPQNDCTYWTVESNECNKLIVDRYAV